MNQTLPCQIDLGYLTLPDFQQLSVTKEDGENEAFSPSGSSNFSRSGSSNSQKAGNLVKVQEAYVPSNYISPEAIAFLISAEASAARYADAVDAGVVEFGEKGLRPTLERTLGGFYDPERIVPSMPPPKKFYRLFWQSISQCLLNRWAREAIPLPSPHSSQN
jgi:hypothetical protein